MFVSVTPGDDRFLRNTQHDIFQRTFLKPPLKNFSPRPCVSARSNFFAAVRYDVQSTEAAVICNVTHKPMSISIQCDDCKVQMKVADQWAGKRAKCKNCGNVIQIPAAATTQDVYDGPEYNAPSDEPPAYSQSPTKQSNALILVVSGAAVFALLIGFAIVHLLNSGSSKSPAETGGLPGSISAVAPSATPKAIADAPPPVSLMPAAVNFPDLPNITLPPKASLLIYKLTIPGNGPGLPMNVRLYLPAGRSELHSLPCVFIAPAGTGMLYGSALGDGDSPEHIPYCLAGFAVVAYELSGDMPGSHDGKILFSSMKRPVQQFMAADGGVANARLAVDFVLAKVPQVDPQQLFAAGHSSAATMALNAVEADHRFRAVAAYAPRCDVVAKWGNELAKLNRVAAGATDLAARVSPMRHVSDVACPVLIFHADNDSRVPTADNEAYVQTLQSAGKSVQFERVATGDHYDSMIRQGVPAGIRFFVENGAHPLLPVRGGK